MCVIQSGGECPAHPPATLSAFEFFHSLSFSHLVLLGLTISDARLGGSGTPHTQTLARLPALSFSYSPVHRPPPKQQPPQTERTTKQQTTETSTFTNAAITTTTSKRLKRYHPLLFVPYKVSSAHCTCSILPQIFSASTAQSPVDRGNAFFVGQPENEAARLRLLLLCCGFTRFRKALRLLVVLYYFCNRGDDFCPNTHTLFLLLTLSWCVFVCVCLEAAATTTTTTAADCFVFPKLSSFKLHRLISI